MKLSQLTEKLHGGTIFDFAVVSGLGAMATHSMALGLAIAVGWWLISNWLWVYEEATDEELGWSNKWPEPRSPSWKPPPPAGEQRSRHRPF